MMRLMMGVFIMTSLVAGQTEISFPTSDGGVLYADLYGTGERGVVLAHGMRFEKSSWKEQATQLANAGFRVLAIDFRGYGKSKGGPNSQSPRDLYLDVLAAADYLRGKGAKTVAVIGASMGGGASANAVVQSAVGSIDRLILLAHAPIQNPERITGPKLFATAQGDPITPQVKTQFEKSPEPKQLLLLDGNAHAQALFKTDQNERLMREILHFLAAKQGVASKR